jgi:hypothetical protein
MNKNINFDLKNQLKLNDMKKGFYVYKTKFFPKIQFRKQVCVIFTLIEC